MQSIVQSPCVRNCCLDEKDICLGCFRSIEEIMQWSGATEQIKRNILQQADIRKNTRKAEHESRIKDDGVFKG